MTTPEIGSGSVLAISRKSNPEVGHPTYVPLNSLEGWRTSLKLGKYYCIAENQGGDDELRARVILPMIKESQVGAVSSASVGHDPCKDDLKGRWSGGVEWLPVISPTVLLLLTGCALLLTGRFLFEVFFGRSRSKRVKQ